MCFPSSVYGVFVCTLYMTFQKFAPTARPGACRIPDEPWMCGRHVEHVIHSECNSSVCFLVPLHKFPKVKHRWLRHYSFLHPAQCAPNPLDPISAQAFKHLCPLSFSVHSLNPLLASKLISFCLFPSSLQQIKKSKTTTLVSAICPTWQQEALFPSMSSRSVKSRLVHKGFFKWCRNSKHVFFSWIFLSVSCYCHYNSIRVMVLLYLIFN